VRVLCAILAGLAALVGAAWPAQGELPDIIEVRVGEERLVPIQGALYVEAADPTVAEAELVAPGLARVRGYREGETLVVVVTAEEAYSVPLRVLPAPPARAMAMRVTPADSYVELVYFPRLATWQVAAWGRGWEAAGSGSGWRVRWSGEELQVLASSNMPVLRLTAFGVPNGWGVDIRSPSGWEIVAGRYGAGIRRFWRLNGGEAGLSWTTAGPLVDVRLGGGDRGYLVDAAFLLQTGPQAAGVVGLRVGEGTWAYYSLSRDGQSVSLSVSRGPLQAAVATDGRSVQGGAAYQGGGGAYGGLWWRSGQGWSLVVGRPVTFAGMPGWVRLELRQDGSVWAYGAFGWSPPPPSLAVALGPHGQFVASGSPSPTLLRLRVVVPGRVETKAEQERAEEVAPGGLLVVRACKDGDKDGACGGRDDVPLEVVVLVDGKVARAWEAVAVPPGKHEIALLPEELPEALIPTSPLRCEAEVRAGGVAACDFVFRDP
jgi:hypothetical protein